MSLLMRPPSCLALPGTPSPPCLPVEFQLALSDPIHLTQPPETLWGLLYPLGCQRTQFIPRFITGLFYLLPCALWGEGWPAVGLSVPQFPPLQVGSCMLLEVIKSRKCAASTWHYLVPHSRLVNFSYYIVTIAIIILLLSLKDKGVAFISASLVAGPECQSKSIKVLIE